jgi:hypothetical protein
MDQRVRAMGLDVQNFVSPVLLTGRGVRAFCSHLTGLSRCQRFLPAGSEVGCATGVEGAAGRVFIAQGLVTLSTSATTHGRAHGLVRRKRVHYETTTTGLRPRSVRQDP